MNTRRSVAVLLLALCAQLAWSAYRPALQARDRELPGAPSAHLLLVASGGDELALARVLMLWLQAFDAGPAGGMPLRALDYHALRSWLGTVADLDPRSRYPLVAASQVYAAVEDPARVRIMLDFVHQRFLREPGRHWPGLAHAAVTARHRLHDLPLALRYARELRQRTPAGALPAWASQLEGLFARDMNELESTRALIGGLIDSGQIRDSHELRRLERRLQELERKLP